MIPTLTKFIIFNTIETADLNISNLEFSYHDRFQWNYIQYRTHESCINLGYDDSYIIMDAQFQRIERILTDKNDAIYIVGKELIVEEIFDNMFKYELKNQLRLRKLNNSIRQCISITVTEENDKINFISICKFNSQVD